MTCAQLQLGRRVVTAYDRGMGRITVRRTVTRITVGEDERRRSDSVVVEEPLEIRLNGTPLAVTMRTPGEDVELAHGFLATEGVIASAEDVVFARYCAGVSTRFARSTNVVGGIARSSSVAGGIARSTNVVGDAARSTNVVGGVARSTGEGGEVRQNTYNVLEVRLAEQVPPPRVDPTRNFYTTSSCGVCGKASIEAITQQLRWDVAADPVRLSADVLVGLPDRLRERQRTFERTGGLHAAGLFTADGELIYAAEDVGRHNAVDKVIGWALLRDLLPARGCVLVVSGRASFELTQKALMAGIPALVAVSAPSSLAVECAEEAGMTLCGFVRSPGMNVYTRSDRIG